MSLTIAQKTVLVTGANRGLGRALVDEALRRGAERVYAASKAASLSVTQSLRALLAGRGVSVHAVLPGPIDTDMVRALDIPKAAPEEVARATLDGVERQEEEIFPDPMSRSLSDSWRAGPAKELERQNAAMLQAAPIAA